MTAAADDDAARLERRLARLASDRGALFDKASAKGRRATQDQQRLRAIEKEIDECFVALRLARATRDARRFDRDRPMIRRAVIPKRPR